MHHSQGLTPGSSPNSDFAWKKGMWTLLLGSIGLLWVLYRLGYVQLRISGEKRRDLRILVHDDGAVEVKWPVQSWVALEDWGAAMKQIVILVFGPRGQVEPMIALAQALQERNLDVRLCAPGCYKELIEESGVSFVFGGVEDVKQFSMPEMVPVYRRIGIAGSRACSGASLIICSPLTTSISLHIAELHRIPCLSVHFVASDVATSEFPPIEILDSKFHGLLPNRIWHFWTRISIRYAMLCSGLAEEDETFRRVDLGLSRSIPIFFLKGIASCPSLHAYSCHVQPRPRDWPKNVLICGPFFRGIAEIGNGRIDEFMALHKDKDIIFVSFGSMQVSDRLYEVCLACAEIFGAVIVGDTRRTSEKEKERAFSASPDGRVLTCRTSINHEMVFAKCSCIIHHGGAGTTQKAILSGAPSLVVPMHPCSDQRYWGKRVSALGCGIVLKSLKAATENPDIVGDAISQILQSRRAFFLRNCRDIMLRMQNEDAGVKVAADAITNFFAGLKCIQLEID